MNNEEIAKPAGHYSHVCVAGGNIYISGQLPVQQDGTPLVNRSFADQTVQVLNNLEGCLTLAGVTKDRLLQVRVYVTDIKDWPTFNRIYSEWIGVHKPARAVAGVSTLHFGLSVEIEAIALS
ncbi:RidA family protein [Rhodoferax sp.]|jgi:2-iminobutanoate/2-iminopropanoate deaminase|uniref:RidA family protein n=1 Tax=Rhodoferax sp. TaxID=50421 RepID=UPI00378409E2